METFSAIFMLAAVVVFLVLLFKLLSAPIRWIFKLLLNAAMGFVILFIVNFFGGFVGFTLGVNLLNALIAGILGVPGVILLVLLKLLL